jgi:hypothetical protein
MNIYYVSEKASSTHILCIRLLIWSKRVKTATFQHIVHVTTGKLLEIRNIEKIREIKLINFFFFSRYTEGQRETNSGEQHCGGGCQESTSIR